MAYIGNEPVVSATRTITEITATAGQTTFTANGGYTVGYVDVIINGSQLQTADFTATNGSTIVLGVAASAGDDVRIVAWGTFQTSSALTSLNPSYTGTLTGGTGVVNIGSGQFYKDASGNVGIGTSSPAYKLDVATNSNTDTAIQVTNVNAGSSVISAFRASNGTNAAIFGIGGTNYNNYAQIRPNGAAIYCNTVAGVGISADNAAGYITFGTGSSAPERMRIDSSGNLRLGHTAGVWNANERFTVKGGSGVDPLATFWTQGTNGQLIFLNSSAALAGYVNWTGTNTTYNTTSDYRLKENIAPMTGALDTVSRLKPVTYTWKYDGSEGQGFIAHELQEVVPECVAGEKDALNEDGSIKPQGIDTSFLIATLTAAIQEQQVMIEELKAKVAALEAA